MVALPRGQTCSVTELPRLTPLPDGPVLVDGPVEVQLPDGSVVRSDRPVVALCTCRRSLLLPWCDTSHRRKVRGDAD